MKTALYLAVLWLLVYHPQPPQQEDSAPCDKIIGLWETPSKDKIEIFKTAGHYYGKLIWGNRIFETDGTSKRDAHNPDSKLKSRPLQGLVVLMDFVFKYDFWDDGKVYDYEGGQTLRGTINLKNNQLILHGYMGGDLFGQSVTWTRVK